MASYSYDYTSTKITVTISGLTAGVSTYKVFVRLANDSGNVTIEQPTQTASASSHTHTFTGLSPNTQYLINVNVNGSWLGSNTFTTGAAPAVTAWDWDASEARQKFYKVLKGTLPADSNNVKSGVWNDIADKVYDLIVATKATSSGNWDATYAALENTYCNPGDTLSAVKFNSVRQNVNRVCTKVNVTPLTDEGVGPVSSGQQIYGIYITKVTDKINQIIANGW